MEKQTDVKNVNVHLTERNDNMRGQIKMVNILKPVSLGGDYAIRATKSLITNVVGLALGIKEIAKNALLLFASGVVIHLHKKEASKCSVHEDVRHSATETSLRESGVLSQN